MCIICLLRLRRRTRTTMGRCMKTLMSAGEMTSKISFLLLVSALSSLDFLVTQPELWAELLPIFTVHFQTARFFPLLFTAQLWLWSEGVGAAERLNSIFCLLSAGDSFLTWHAMRWLSWSLITFSPPYEGMRQSRNRTRRIKNSRSWRRRSRGKRRKRNRKPGRNSK